MPLDKQTLNLNFGQGLDTKTDPWQVKPGKFLALTNTVFNSGGLLTKRNGFASLTSLPNTTSTTATTFKGSLVATGTSLQTYSPDAQAWENRGNIQPCDLSVKSIVQTNSSLTAIDSAIASNNLMCVVYRNSASAWFYQVVESDTGLVIVGSTALPASATHVRVYTLGPQFLITFKATVAASPHLQYIAIPIGSPSVPGTATDISTAVAASGVNDGCVANNLFYVAWMANDGGGAVRALTISVALSKSSEVVIFSAKTATLLSVTADTSIVVPNIWFTSYDSGASTGQIRAYSFDLTALFATTQWISATTVDAIATSARGAQALVFYSVNGTYSWNSKQTDTTNVKGVTNAGVVGSAGVLMRGAVLASKAFYFPYTNKNYALLGYGHSTSLEPTYFLAAAETGAIVAQLAPSNAVGYATTDTLPSITVNGSQIFHSYLIQDQVTPVNKAQGVAGIASANPVYATIGGNLATYEFNTNQIPSEIGNNLHLSGGVLTMYDGNAPVEHGFFVYPEDIGVTLSAAGGVMTHQKYFYYGVYAWTDNQGTVHRSAPSVPVIADMSNAGTYGGDTNSVTVHFPCLRATAKPLTSIRLEIYRWSTAQQIPYLITSISSPTANADQNSVDYVDAVADGTILGNLVLYTFGGTIENICVPAVKTMNLFKSRMFALQAENRNVVSYSKQVIQGTPVEFSDLQTVYVPPTIGAQGSTGDLQCLSAMDDKEIFFKKDAILYMTGNGPDLLGQNNDFSDPILITSTVGCQNQRSIVLTPNGILFQSDKGIWLLGRDLSTSYIGAPVEAYNSATVLSAQAIPGTNQVRFDLNSNVTLVFDYYYDQWSTFSNLNSISSTLYQGEHTLITSAGTVYQESPGQYLDGSKPVLMSFTTAWIALAGLQGYQRAYYFYLLGKYFSPHFLTVGIAYDYDSAIVQPSLISPVNFNGAYGSGSFYGDGTPYGGNSNVEQWRVFLDQQKCQAFQITVSESFDPSLGQAAGAGLTLSGINLVVGAKSGYPRLPASQSVG